MSHIIRLGKFIVTTNLKTRQDITWKSPDDLYSGKYNPNSINVMNKNTEERVVHFLESIT